MPASRNGEQKSLISKVGDEETGPVKKQDRSGNGGFCLLVLASLVITAGIVLGAIALAGGFSSGGDDDDDGGSSDSNSHSSLDKTCSFERIREGLGIACHDPTGCGGPDDKSEWCYVSDDLQPLMFAKIYDDLISMLDRNSALAQIGLKLANLSSTCVVNACKERKCLCYDNGNGTSYCEAVNQEEFPFITIEADNYPNCEPPEEESDEADEGPKFFQGNPTECACLDDTGCAHPDNPTSRCFASKKHDGADDSCFPGACAEKGLYLCECIDHGNGTSSCPTTLPFREVHLVPNCETYYIPPPSGLPGEGDEGDSGADSDSAEGPARPLSEEGADSLKESVGDLDSPIEDDDSLDASNDGAAVGSADSDAEPHHCTFEHIVEKNSIACHDPVGCSGPDDKTEWCYVSDDEQPVMWASLNQELISLVARNSTIGKIGLMMANLSSTCVVGACVNRPCLCTDNGNGTSFCEAFHEVTFPFRDVDADNYPNCEPSDEPETTLEDEGAKFFEGDPTFCACQDLQGCAAPEFPSDRCFVSTKHDGARDSCIPGACGMLFPCECVDYGNGTSSCPAFLPFRESQLVPNCETFLSDEGSEGGDSPN